MSREQGDWIIIFLFIIAMCQLFSLWTDTTNEATALSAQPVNIVQVGGAPVPYGGPIPVR